MVYFACRNAASTRRMIVVVLSVSTAVAVLTALLMVDLRLSSVAARQQPTHDLRGTVVVPFGTSSEPVSCGITLDEAFAVLGGEATASCPAGPLGAWSDVADGATIRVTDRAGAVLATTRLTGGEADHGAVTFSFTATDVPDADGYGVEVNTRGVLRWSHDRLVRDGWRVTLDLR